MLRTNCLIGFPVLTSFLILAGCANDPYFSPPPTAEVRAGLGKVAVQSAPSVTHVGVDKPYTPGKAAAAGAMEAIGGIGGSGGGGDLGGIEIVLVPIAAVVGGTWGGMHGTPEAEAQADWQVLSNACAKLDFQKALRRDVITAIGKYTRVPVAQRDADTLLELSVLEAGLVGERYKDSPLTVFIKVQARLVRLSDSQEVYKHIWTHKGRIHTYEQWAGDDARLFRKELSRVCGEVAVIMVREMFLPKRSRKDDWWSGDHAPKYSW